ncbi:MAG: DUF3592 domain-containing protein [Pseudomonadota bacterium]|nr:DUF3592 domain-containing protein [Pseudomonadota bacterium]
MPPPVRTGLHPAIPGGLAAVLFLLASIPLALAWTQMAADARAESWQATQATISTSQTYDASYRDQRDGLTRTKEEYELVFEYAVDGRVYQGTALDPGGFVSWSPQDVVTRWPVGAHVQAWYDPEDPSVAALTRERSASRFILLGATLLVVLLGALFGVVSLKLLFR